MNYDEVLPESVSTDQDTEETLETLTTGTVISGLSAVEENPTITVASEGSIELQEQIVTEDLDTFLAQPITVTGYEYKMLNGMKNVEAFSFISMLLIVILIVTNTKRFKKSL